jgi:two-component system NtrC family sensor kinase
MSAEKKIERLNKKISILEKMIEDKTRENFNNEEKLKEQQAQIMFNAKLASIGEMASSIAHEVNNPVGIIEGQLRRLRHHIENGNLEEQLNLVEKIENNTERVIKIVNGLRQLSKSTENEELKIISLKDFFDGFKEYNHIKTIDSSVEIIFPHFVEDIQIWGKDTSLAQIVTNLINNSLDAIGGDPSPWIKINVAKGGDFCLLTFVDCGKGVDETHISKLFDPFFTTKSHEKGTGVGLNICKKLAKELNGDLSYQLTEGNTSFVLKLKVT